MGRPDRYKKTVTTTDPSPGTPRQREILRRLQLVGGAPASYFRDACRLMAKEPELESQTHLVGHLLRELNSGLLAALRPMVPAESWPGDGADNAQAKRIDAICDALRVPGEDNLRRSWTAFSRRLARLAHRGGLVAPRAVDRDFEEHWELGEAVLDTVTQRIEANYAENLPRIEQLARGEPDIKAYRDTMLHSIVALDRFFSLAGVEWLGPLRDDGAFNDPPPLVANEDGMYVYPRWPQGQFLARVATDAPREVIEIGQSLKTDNPEACESLVAAALNMEVSDAVSLVKPIGEWLRNPIHWGLPFKVRDLIVRFVDASAVEEGLALMQPLVASAKGGNGVDGEQVMWLSERVFPAVGIAGLDLLADLMTEEAEAEGGRSPSYSQMWRPDIGSERMRDDRDHLVSAVRDAAAALVVGGADLGDVVAALERPDLEITRRIALDLLSRHVGTDVANRYLLDRSLLEESAYRREYSKLAEAGFGDLPATGQGQLLEWIGEAAPYAENPQRQRIWQLQMLNALGDQLPEEWISRRVELEKEIGPVESAAAPFPQPRFVGSRSPITADEIREMGVDALLDFLRSWEPEDGFDVPSREGLASVLEGAVKDAPRSFAHAAPRLGDVDPTYARAVLRGLGGALEAGLDFEWGPVLELIAAISRQPSDSARRAQVADDGDPDWSWSWQQALELILRGLGRSVENRIDDGHFGVVMEVVRVNVDRADHSLMGEREDGEASESLALNSVRCTALRVAIVLAARKREMDDSGEGPLDSDVAAILETHLDADVEPSAAVRSIYGWYFGMLLYCDEAWAVARASKVFPVEDQRLWRAAWESFVMRNDGNGKLLDVLGASYRHAIEGISAEKAEERLNDPDEALIVHLVSYYVSGFIDLGNDSLLDLFYEKASHERRSEVISLLGASMEALSPLGEEGEARLRALAERRLKAVEDTDADELAGFAWWFSSGLFETNWSLDFLRRALESGCHPHPDHVIAERLVELRGESLAERVEILRLMVEGGAREWFVLGSRERIRAILQEGLAGGAEVASRTRDLINVIVARGNLDFADLLGAGESDDLGQP